MNNGLPNALPDDGPSNSGTDARPRPSGEPSGPASDQDRREAMDRFVSHVTARLAAIGDRGPRRRRGWLVVLLVVLLVVAAGAILGWYYADELRAAFPSALGFFRSDGIKPVEVLFDLVERHSQ